MSGLARYPVFTLGHSTRPLAEFLALLRAHEVGCVVDVRRYPGSRAMPQYAGQALRRSLHGEGIAYVWMPALGGRRGRSLPAGDRRNGWWQNPSFRHYADYALGVPFALAMGRLERRVDRTRCALMCAEAVWWRCHRRILADHLLARGHEVFHIMGPDKAVQATLSEGARCRSGTVTYPGTDADGWPET